jgi:hypothetical protein
VADAARRSPTIQSLIDRLETLDVTVYIRRQRFAQLDLQGRVGLLSTAGSHRYLVIELACMRTELPEMSILGHELFHAVEIGSESSIVDARSLAAFYSRIGMLVDNSGGRRSFETKGAADAGRQTLRELVFSPRRSVASAPATPHPD